MFDELSKYKHIGQFYFRVDESLVKSAKEVPKDKGGVYLVYNIDADELIYIGSTGKMQQDGNLKVRQDGMKGRIIKGKQFEQPRKISWSLRMQEDKCTQILVKWFVTFDEQNRHIPAAVEGKLIQEYFDSKGKLPFWNIEF